MQRIVVALVLGPGVLGSGRGGQGVQHGGDDGGALGGQIPGDDPGPAERGLRPDAAVLEIGQQVIVGGIRQADVPGAASWRRG